MGRFLQALKDTASAQKNTEATIVLEGLDPIEVFARPLRGDDMQFISRKHPDFMTRPNFAGQVDLIVRKARLKSDESLAFDEADKPFLLKQSTTFISEIFANLFSEQMSSNADEEVDKAKGN